MSIEPLQNLIRIYNDKYKALLYYLPNKTTNKLKNYKYVHDLSQLFLNDNLLFVKKNTGLIYKHGIVIKITDNKITIKTNLGNISLCKDDYYIFIKLRKNNLHKNNRRFYDELLKSLN